MPPPASTVARSWRPAALLLAAATACCLAQAGPESPPAPSTGPSFQQALELTDKEATALAAGDTLVLIGPSGCGKSTLLRLMIGLIRPDAGCVQFERETLSPENAMLLRRMHKVIREYGSDKALIGNTTFWPFKYSPKLKK